MYSISKFESTTKSYIFFLKFVMPFPWIRHLLLLLVGFERFILDISFVLFQQSYLISYGRIDANGSRFLLGNISGKLFMLFLETEEMMDGNIEVKNLKVELVGEVCSGKDG